ncbi:hypothetical protein [Nocardia gamkensis]|uniref:Uncharacterized protein n=1 Tax=Nocardia gamkensis TaxID=352869 RepID=A0A7X6R360_9NOCA|nr:hypothetical protein [Nocardia gamkensis]NKY26947.1 hypothetical protein [Nocardia gamkensis]NQE68389.1 hypothetical protein [Nocardia gamkensis]
MTIAVAIRATMLTSAWVLGPATIADAEPVRAANDEIVCFVHAIEPWKTDWYKHAERIDTSTDPDVQALYSASCSSAGILYGFHTQVEVTAIAGTWDDGGDNSATISAIC